MLLALACATPAPVEPVGVAQDALEVRRKALADEVRTMVTELEAAGRYDCCVATPCKTCALRAGGCRCGDAARSGEPVCDECAAMWVQGQGAEPVDPREIYSFLEAQRAMSGEVCGERVRRLQDRAPEPRGGDAPRPSAE